MRPAIAAVLALALAAGACDTMKDLFTAQRAVQSRFGTTQMNLNNDTDLSLAMSDPRLLALDTAAKRDTALAVARFALQKLPRHPIQQVTVSYQDEKDYAGVVHVSQGRGTYTWSADDLREPPQAQPASGRP